MALLGCFAAPSCGLFLIFCDAYTPSSITASEVVLRARVPLLGSLKIPAQSFVLVLLDASAIGIADTEAELRVSFTSRSALHQNRRIRFTLRRIQGMGCHD
jgi:hypothetical protein